MAKQEPFALVEGESIVSAIEAADAALERDDEDGFLSALSEALGDFDDSVEIISAHRRDTVRRLLGRA